MTDAPELVWFTDVDGNILPNSERRTPQDVEYIRKDIADAAVLAEREACARKIEYETDSVLLGDLIRARTGTTQEGKDD